MLICIFEYQFHGIFRRDFLIFFREIELGTIWVYLISLHEFLILYFFPIGVILLMIVIIVVVTTTQNQDQIKENVNVGSENVHKEGPGSTPNSGPGEKVPEDMSSGSSSGGTGNSNESVKPYAG